MKRCTKYSVCRRRPAPVALAVADDGAVFVAGELASHVARFTWQAGKLAASGQWQLDDIRAVRGIAAGAGGWIYVAEERAGRLIALRLEHAARTAREAHRARPFASSHAAK